MDTFRGKFPDRNCFHTDLPKVSQNCSAFAPLNLYFGKPFSHSLLHNHIQICTFKYLGKTAESSHFSKVCLLLISKQLFAEHISKFFFYSFIIFSLTVFNFQLHLDIYLFWFQPKSMLSVKKLQIWIVHVLLCWFLFVRLGLPYKISSH